MLTLYASMLTPSTCDPIIREVKLGTGGLKRQTPPMSMSTDETARKSYHHGDLREALLAAAQQMIAEEGVEAVTMRGLSQRVGVSRTAPYRHFKDKATLLAAVAQQGFEQLITSLRQVRTSDPTLSPLIRFERMGIGYVRFAIQNPTAYRLMFGVDAIQADDHPALRDIINETHHELIAILRECKEAGLIRAWRSRDVAVTVWSACHGLSLLLIDGHLPGVEELVSERMAAILSAGLGATN